MNNQGDLFSDGKREGQKNKDWQIEAEHRGIKMSYYVRRINLSPPPIKMSYYISLHYLRLPKNKR